MAAVPGQHMEAVVNAMEKVVIAARALVRSASVADLPAAERVLQAAWASLTAFYDEEQLGREKREYEASRAQYAAYGPRLRERKASAAAAAATAGGGGAETVAPHMTTRALTPEEEAACASAVAARLDYAGIAAAASQDYASMGYSAGADAMLAALGKNV